MKKILKAFLLAAALVLSLSSCRSTLEPALELAEYRKNTKELDFGAVLDDQNGYHYPGLSWGISLDEVQKVTRDAVTKIVGVSEDGNVVYTAGYLNNLIEGRKNDDAQVGTTEKDELMSVMLVFTNENLKDGDIKQSVFYDAALKKLTAEFGQPDLTEKHTDSIQGGFKADVEDLIWEKTLPDGRLNRMVFSKAYVSYSGEPDYVSLAFETVTSEE